MNFDAMLHAVECVLTFALLGCVGYVLAKKGWFDASSQILLSRLVTVVALPPYLFYSIASSFTRDELLHLIYGSAVPFVTVLVNFFIAHLLVWLLKVRHNRRGLFCGAFSFSNTIYIGLPVNLALFGEVAIPYALLFYFAYTIVFWTAGNFFISHDGEGANAKILSMKTVRSIFSPPLCGFLAGMTMLLLDLKIPTFIAGTAKYLGGMTTPLIIMTVGITLHSMGIRNIKLDRDVLVALLGRFIVCPAIIIFASWVVPLPDLMRKVFIIQASLPVMSTLPMLATLYKTDTEYAAVVLSASTLLSMVSIPVFMFIVTHI